MDKTANERRGPQTERTHRIIVVQLLCHVGLFATPWTAACHVSHCPPLSSRVCSHPCPLSQSYYLTISSSAAPFSFCLQSFPASGPFPVRQLFTSGGQRRVNPEYSLEKLFLWSANTLATSWEETTHWKRPWCWKRLKAKKERSGRGWDGYMALPT